MNLIYCRHKQCCELSSAVAKLIAPFDSSSARRRLEQRTVSRAARCLFFQNNFLSFAWACMRKSELNSHSFCSPYFSSLWSNSCYLLHHLTSFWSSVSLPNTKGASLQHHGPTVFCKFSPVSDFSSNCLLIKSSTKMMLGKKRKPSVINDSAAISKAVSMFQRAKRVTTHYQAVNTVPKRERSTPVPPRG